ncbi:FecR family protein [Xanthocytophaga agilis]|uniref:FecR domain-containing protein n=1 Tax=Xanthocytophaga agilis TaxID=3048010 RepID=A0AAE3R838_9BACT|nr:FecR domain-containing protein [Xanthocytophaga agilis]MDJ1502507.1 FecR domain-containing protein [Xanthocytophaga agilis]
MTDYSDFSAEDFAMDDYFIQWVKSSADSSTSEFWTSWLERYPDKKDTIVQARQLVLSVDFEETFPDQKEVQSMWQVISDQAFEEEILERETSTTTIFRTQVFKIAASILLLVLPIGGGLYYWYSQQQEVSYLTQNGQVKTVLLPDGSQVTLNANSVIRFNPSLQTDHIREVWLDGEAFFHVKRTASKARFIVHTKQLNVEVLGTTFNVNTRHKKTRVILNTGKVTLTLSEHKQDPPIQMIPGDLVEFKESEKKILKKTVNPDTYSSWTQSKLVFDGTSLAEIIEILADTQGIKLTLQDTSMASLQFSGSVSANRTDLLLLKLSKAFRLNIVRQPTGEILLEKSTHE